MDNLSLALAVKGHWTAQDVLQKLQEAGVPNSVEVHLACDEDEAPCAAGGRLKIYAASSKSLFALWAIAIRGSRSPWVAILHPDALPAPGWFDAINEAIRKGDSKQGVWGPVEPAFGPFDSRMIGYLTEYVQFHRPVDPRLNEVPGSNLVLPRDVAESGETFNKTHLLRQGFSPTRVDKAMVLYDRSMNYLKFCQRRFRHARAYAADRPIKHSVIFFVIMTLFLPVIRVKRIFLNSWRHKHLRVATLRWLPAILMAETFWSVGELVGYWTGRSGNVAALD